MLIPQFEGKVDISYNGKLHVVNLLKRLEISSSSLRRDCRHGVLSLTTAANGKVPSQPFFLMLTSDWISFMQSNGF